MNTFFLDLEKKITAGDFDRGVPLPSAAELASELGTSVNEIEDAIRELIYEGYLERVRPEPVDEVRIPTTELWATLGGSHSITKEAKRRGQKPGVQIIDWSLVDAWPGIRERLDLSETDKVQIMERLRSADDVPVGIEVSYFPAKHYPGITQDLFTEGGSGQSSFKVMEEKFGLKSARATDEVTVVCLEKREAALLKVPSGTPVVERFRVTISDKGIPIKASRALWLFRAKWEMDL